MLHVKTVLKIISLWRCILLSVMHDWLTVADVMQVDFWLQSLENLIIIDIRDSKNADNVKTFQSLKLSRTAVSAGKWLLKGTEQQVWQLKINWTKNFLEVTQSNWNIQVITQIKNACLWYQKYSLCSFAHCCFNQTIEEWRSESGPKAPRWSLDCISMYYLLKSCEMMGRVYKNLFAGNGRRVSGTQQEHSLSSTIKRNGWVTVMR